VAGILAVAGFLFVPDGFLLMVSLLLLAFLVLLGFLLFLSNMLLLVVLLLLALAVDGVLPVAGVPADPVVPIGLSKIVFANSRNYCTIRSRIKASIYRTIRYQDFRLRKNYPLPTSENK
jgi:hypothetical protein